MCADRVAENCMDESWLSQDDELKACRPSLSPCIHIYLWPFLSTDSLNHTHKSTMKTLWCHYRIIENQAVNWICLHIPVQQRWGRCMRSIFGYVTNQEDRWTYHWVFLARFSIWNTLLQSLHLSGACDCERTSHQFVWGVKACSRSWIFLALQRLLHSQTAHETIWRTLITAFWHWYAIWANNTSRSDAMIASEVPGFG